MIVSFNMNISVVIPNYNGENLLRKNLPKIIEEMASYKKGQVEVIVIDDFSKDKSIEVLEGFKNKYKNFKFLVNSRNLGFSSTVNNGVSHVSGEIILLLNTDVYPEKGFLEPLLLHFNNQEIFAVGCMEKSIEGEKIVLRGRGIGKWQRGFLMHSRGEVDKKETLWVSCGSGAFRKSIWDKIGGLNSLYNPFYWEDIDLSYRAQKVGYKVLFEPESVVFHEHEKGAIKNAYSGFKIKTIAYRNQFIFVWLNATDFKIRVSHLIYLPYHIIKALFRVDGAFFLGLFSALIMVPKVIKLDFKLHKQFRVKDREVVKNIAI